MHIYIYIHMKRAKMPIQKPLSTMTKSVEFWKREPPPDFINQAWL